MEYITVKEASEKWGMDVSAIGKLLRADRIPGSAKLGGHWVIPRDAPRPADGRRRAADGMPQPELYRFPLYMNFPEDSFTPPLSPEEMCLRQAQTDFFACAFDRAWQAFSDLAENTENVHIRIAATAFLCVLSTHSRKGEGHSALFGRLNMELMREFPHKRETELFLPWVYDFLGERITVSGNLKLDPTYPYSADCLPFMAVLSYSHLSGIEPERASEVNLDVYELQCRQAEASGYFYEAQEMHYLLFIIHHLINHGEAMFYHLRQGLRLAQEHGLLLVSACYAFLYPEESSQILGEFPEEFTEKLLSVSVNVQASFACFATENENTSIYKTLLPEDFPFAFYTVMGYSNKEVAKMIKKSEKTVANRYSEIYAKLHIAGKRELASLVNASLKA